MLCVHKSVFILFSYISLSVKAKPATNMEISDFLIHNQGKNILLSKEGNNFDIYTYNI